MSSRHFLLVAILSIPALRAQQSCDKLSSLNLPRVQVTSAEAAPAGKIQTNPSTSIEVPARCVVKLISRPTSDSEIKIEIWMPAEKWNGRYMQVGNGGWAGAIPVPSIATAMLRGYAAAGTDDGHAGNHPDGPAGWAIGHPEKLIDFGYRALHQTNIQAKAIIRAFYGKDPAQNYFFGCSDGGREALMEAQKYPEDFNGIIAGAPANQWSYHFAGFVWNEQALLNDPGSRIPPNKLPAVHKAALAACDANDGAKDGLIEDPRTCKFDPAVMACQGDETAECLTPKQVVALKKIYDGPKNPRTGKQIYPGYPPGHEALPAAWVPWIIAPEQEKSIQIAFGNSFFGQAVFENPKWDFRTLDFDTDVAYAYEKAGVVLNSDSPDLRSFRARGGKLIQYHGWADAAISPFGSIDYYEKVLKFFQKYPDPRGGGKPVSDFYRLFMVPGMGHCAGGAGPNSFGNAGLQFYGDPNRDVVTALEQWVEKGVAPEQLVGTGKSALDSAKPLTRPLCVYPQVARYDGSGDPANAASFRCALPQQ